MTDFAPHTIKYITKYEEGSKWCEREVEKKQEACEICAPHGCANCHRTCVNFVYVRLNLEQGTGIRSSFPSIVNPYRSHLVSMSGYRSVEEEPVD